MHKLIAHFLGTFSIVLDGKPLEGFVSARARGLFVFLLYNAGTFFTRGYLATLLWPDLPQPRAMSNLRNVLFHLRKMFPPDAPLPFLEVTRAQVVIHPVDGMHVDAREFLDCWRRAERQEEDWLGLLERAAELYRGDLLEGFQAPKSETYEAWLRNEREHLHNIAIHVYTRLAAYYEQVGLYDRAIHYVQNLLRLAPWDVDVHMRLMRLFALQGNRARALAQYHTFLRIWKEEFNSGPPDEIRALYERLKAGEPWVTEGKRRGRIDRFASSIVVLPSFVVPFVGREKEMRQIEERLRDPRCRLITLVGMGGIGKSRLAIEAARAHQAMFPDGVYFIPLEAVDSPSHVLLAIARALRIPLKEGSHLAEGLFTFLADKQMLLILDNFEHLIEARTQIIDLLAKTQYLKILITSREALHLFQEWVIPVSGLAFPPDATVPDLERYDAVRLFVTMARRVRPNLTLGEGNIRWVVEVCRQVQGSPLAIALASAWLRDLPLNEVARIVSGNLDLLMSTMPDLPARQQSMRAVFDNSWALLNPEERRAFRQLSIFEGPFSSEAAREVAYVPLSVLRNLVQKSLLSLVENHGYGFHPLLHAYARERLGQHPEEARTVAERHALYITRLVREQNQRLHSPHQQEALQRIEQVWPDIRSAWRWLLRQGAFREIDGLLEPLYVFFEVRGFWMEAFDLLWEAERAIRGVHSDSVHVTLGRVKMFRAWFAVRMGRKEEAQGILEEAQNLLDRGGTVRDRAVLAHVRGVVYKELGDYEMAIRLQEESIRLARETDALPWVAQALIALSLTLDTKGAPLERVRLLAEEALAIYRMMGDPIGIARALVALGNAYYRQGELKKARAAYEESLHIRQTLGNPLGIAVILANLGSIAYIQGQYDEALQFFREAARAYRELGSRFGWAFMMLNIGMVAEARNDLEEAQRYYLLAHSLFNEQKHEWGILMANCYLADLYMEQGYQEQAHRLLQEALELATDLQATPPILRVLVSVGHYLMHCGQMEEARKILSTVIAHPYADMDLRERLKRLLTGASSRHVSNDWEDWIRELGDMEVGAALQIARKSLNAECG